MAIDVLLELNGKNFTASTLSGVDIERNKLWDSNSGRLINGKWVGTLIGIFPKIVDSFYPKDEIELSSLMVELDKPSLNVRYYNPKTRSMVNLGTYTSDYKVTLLTTLGYEIEPVKVSFISTERER